MTAPMNALDRVRRIVLALPGVNERMSHGEPCFFIRDKRPLCYFHDDHNGDGRISLRVRPEVSQLTSSTVSIGGYQIPGLTTRRAETTVELVHHTGGSA